ncbi:protein of unknown function [Modestobacter italicus]|uniref:Uncharacterized protein n=1 Tax=Modestobacter italicus (strain DSM 44449 / CECT 9708 / BC 501) TaxID=2732864 RepID=I4F1M0_MODI5|nr:protein of unknown function [Modestobacter marinus]
MLRAVRARVKHSQPLDPWVRQAIQWRREGSVGNPPWVAVLAVTVLAASGAGREEDGRVLHERAYYRPLRQLLGLLAGAQPPGFDSDIRMLWTFLKEWLDDHLEGSRGLSTARAPRHLSNVGWAMSQVVLTSAERSRLPEFFQLIGAVPGEDITPDALLASYLRWGSRRRASRIHDDVRAQSNFAEMLGAALHQALISWDGRPRDERGRTTLPLLLGYYSSRGQLRLVSRAAHGLENRGLKVGADEVYIGARDELFVVPGDPDTALAGRPIRASLSPSEQDPVSVAIDIQMRLLSTDIHVLASNGELGMWVEVAAASLDQEHVIIVRDQVAPEAERAMTDLGGGAMRLPRIRLPAGWCAYHRFHPTRLAQVPVHLSALVPGRTELAQLTGGLPVDRLRKLWLTDGPPDVILPEILDAQAGRVLRLDGAELPWPDDNRLRLRSLGLHSGDHELSVAGRTMRLTLLDEVVDHAGHGDARLTVERQPVEQTFLARARAAGASHGSPTSPTDACITVTLCGARLSTTEGSLPLLPRPHQLRVGGCYYVLGAPGQAARLRPVAPPWLTAVEPPLYSRDADLESTIVGLSFAPRWLLYVPAGRRATVTDISDVSARAGRDTAVRAPDFGAEIWQQASRHLELAEVAPQDMSAWRAWLSAAGSAGQYRRSTIGRQP